VLLALQRISGTRLHLLHTHASESLRLIREAKLRGQGVTCEVDPKYFHMLHSDIAKHGGKGIPGGYVTEDEARMAEIWRSLRDGTVNNIATDHAPHTSEEADYASVNAWEAHLGSPQLEWLYALVLTDVADGKLSLARGVQLLTEGPAKVVGVWPEKGAIAPGSLADLAILDLNREWVVTEDNLQTKVQWSPYVGRRFKGKVMITLSRGRVVAEDGKITAEPGSGQYISGISRPLVQ
jgi:dihydroorotase